MTRLAANAHRRDGCVKRAGHDDRGITPAIGAAVLVSAVAACSAFGTTGSGPVKTETREVALHRVDVSAGIGIDIQIGAAGPVTISAEENILPLILTHLDGDTLLIHSSASFVPRPGSM